MMASGMLSNRPKQSPTPHPGQGKRAAPITNPMPNRAMNAAVIAAFLSGKLIGSMIPMSMAPNTKPQMTPSRTLDISPLFRLLLMRAVLVNQLIRPVSTRDLQFPPDAPKKFKTARDVPTNRAGVSPPVLFSSRKKLWVSPFATAKHTATLSRRCHHPYCSQLEKAVGVCLATTKSTWRTISHAFVLYRELVSDLFMPTLTTSLPTESL